MMACGLNGSNQFLTVPVDSAFEFGTGDFTVAYQLNLSGISGKNSTGGLSLGRGAYGVEPNLVTSGWWLRYSNVDFSFYRYDGTTETNLSRSFTFALNTPYHVLATRQGTSLRLFVNGGQQGAAFTSSLSYNRVLTGGSQDLHLGRIFAGGTGGDPVSGAPYLAYWLNGAVSEVGIWKAGLTDAEITALSNGFTADQIRPQSLSFYAPLMRDFQDLRNGLVITNNNNATVATHPRIIT